VLIVELIAGLTTSYNNVLPLLIVFIPVFHFCGSIEGDVLAMWSKYFRLRAWVLFTSKQTSAQIFH